MLKLSVSESGMQPNYPHLLNDRRMPKEHNSLGDRNIFHPEIKARVMLSTKRLSVLAHHKSLKESILIRRSSNQSHTLAAGGVSGLL
jgi:hypothetical protein